MRPAVQTLPDDQPLDLRPGKWGQKFRQPRVSRVSRAILDTNGLGFADSNCSDQSAKGTLLGLWSVLQDPVVEVGRQILASCLPTEFWYGFVQVAVIEAAIYEVAEEVEALCVSDEPDVVEFGSGQDDDNLVVMAVQA
jgi:hypothetical protein